MSNVYRQFYSLTPAGEAWFEGRIVKLMVGEPGHYSGGREVRIGQSIETLSNLHEFGHSYFRHQQFPVTGHPELRWDDGQISY